MKTSFSSFRLVVLTCFLLTLALELLLRFAIGLGNPPLYRIDPEIEYYLKPNQTCRRYQNHYLVNSYGMRSDNFEITKSSPSELRILVIGDSLVNGGAQLDQNALATEQLKKELEDQLDTRVVTGNISAESWGPQNWLAYLNRFGFFNADMVFLVISSHDWYDIPSFVEPDHIQVTDPHFALVELAEIIYSKFSKIRPNDTKTRPPRPKDASKALSELFLLIKSQGIPFWVIQSAEKRELLDGPKAAHFQIEKLAKQFNIPILDLYASLKSALTNERDPFLDNIHLNSIGQNILGNSIKNTVTSFRLKPSK